MEIVKYKAWNTKKNCYEKLALRFIEIDGAYVCSYNPNIIEILEFINSYDKDGKELYEYDIIEYKYNNEIIHAYIKWDKTELAYVAVTINESTDENPRENIYLSITGYKKLSSIISGCKKVGNAFENKNIYNSYRGR